MSDGRTRLVSISDAAKELGLAPVTLRSWIAKRRIASVKLGRSIRIPSSELDRLVERGAIPALPERSR
jgi:excisionase family DNA binding protein